MISKSSSSASLWLTSRRISKRYSRSHLRILRKREAQVLKTLLPTIAHKKKVAEITVIEEAIKHISRLEKAIMERLHPDTNLKTESAKMETADNLCPVATAVSSPAQTFIQTLLPANFVQTAIRPPRIEAKPLPKCPFPLPRYKLDDSEYN